MAVLTVNSSWVRIVLLVLAGFVVIPVVLYRMLAFSSPQANSGPSDSMNSGTTPPVLKVSLLDLLEGEEIPPQEAQKKPQVLSQYKDVQVDKESFKIFYTEATPSPDTHTPTHQVLLLHGNAFSSANWLELGTLRLLATLGHRVIAVDLPGYGKSTGSKSTVNHSAFMMELINTLDLGPTPVIISPSMSGRYSLPFLVSYPSKVKGYIPVAPAATDLYVDEYHDITVPTVIVVGSRDRNIGPASVKNLSLLPNHVVVTLPDAGHPAYLDQPDLWHKMLYHFLRAL